MRDGLRQSMAWLHTWSGLIVGWVLFAVFVTGTASYYRADISRWMQPELKVGEARAPEAIAASVERGVAYLQIHAGAARAWFITPPRPDKPVVELFWRNRPGLPPGHVLLDPETGAPAQVRDTKGGDFLYQFHFELHMAPLWGRWIVGICSMIMLVALISGIITHRRIFADFFTLRRDRSAQRGWLDAHNVTGVLALPFHLMITYTGIAILGLTYMPWGVTAAYRGDTQALFAESGQVVPIRPPSGQPGTLAPVGPIVLRGIAAMPQAVERVSIRNPKDAHATVIVMFEEPHGLSHEHPQIAFDGTSGAILGMSATALRPATRTFATLVGLHEAHFAGPVLRVLFFLSGLMGCAMVASGLVLWSVSRMPNAGERASFGLRLVQALNIGTVVGLPGAVAVYFLANRLLPLDLAGRAEWEIQAFFGAWIAVGLMPLVRPHRRAWYEGLALVSVLYLAVVAADLIVLADHPVRRSGGDPLFAWFDGAMLLLSGFFAIAARKVRHYAAPRRIRNTAQAAAVTRGLSRRTDLEPASQPFPIRHAAPIGGSPSRAEAERDHKNTP
ncbi:PepSY-associated TM helix domain-containing protein [Methylobacterium flocculans]|uniref:PepSY-associated TM helix domain-containing protein n=1 Tax=Methylobacterium flocculans TaxID=2984843 RepID=UPI0021F27B30|nr:PepSY-associated TM helix domain-containing protein [Methylobacterium sp. FF17]